MSIDSNSVETMTSSTRESADGERASGTIFATTQPATSGPSIQNGEGNETEKIGCEASLSSSGNDDCFVQVPRF